MSQIKRYYEALDEVPIDDPLPLPGEVFRPIPGFQGCYEVSNFGRVKSLERTAYTNVGDRKFRPVHPRILHPSTNRSGCDFVTLYTGSSPAQSHKRSVRKLVREVFPIGGDTPDNVASA